MRKCNLKNCIALILSITICCSSLSGVAFATDGIPESVEGQSTNQPASMLDVLAGVVAPSELYDPIDSDNLIRSAIEWNYGESQNNENIADFAHMQISLSARMAYSLNRDGILSNIGTFCSDEDVSYLAGWLGDATLHDPGQQTTLGNDDYHADLDAENVYQLVLEGKSLVDATNEYYASLTSQNTRADVFLQHIDFATIEAKINEELIDKELRMLMRLAAEQGFADEAQRYRELLEDDEYHQEVIKSYPDTYNFLCSVRDRLADIADYS